MPSVALRTARRLITRGVLGIAGGAILGVIVVVVGWFPSAMVDFAQHPNYLDPRATLLAWSAVWGVLCGGIGGVIGLGVGALSAPGRGD